MSSGIFAPLRSCLRLKAEFPSGVAAVTDSVPWATTIKRGGVSLGNSIRREPDERPLGVKTASRVGQGATVVHLPAMSEAYQNALLGALVADAAAMPVHWYYDTAAMDRDYGDFGGYETPRNPHPDSILWRSRYEARNEKGEILHDQAQYWGKRGVHYHQFLPAGDNTVNFLLGIQLYRTTVRAGHYDPDAWLGWYVELMRTPGWHRDTYLEEYHRAFFDNYARGREPRDCGIEDLHIGGLTPVPFLVAALDAVGDTDPGEVRRIVREHLALTHRSRHVLEAGEAYARMLQDLAGGAELRETLRYRGSAWIRAEALEAWSRLPDRSVVGRRLTPACYLPESFAAALFLAWKYADDFSAGILANAKVGGDNCHRGAVVGGLLGAARGVPDGWLEGLRSMKRMRCDTLKPVFER